MTAHRTMPFGRYRGWRIADVPSSYLGWLLTIELHEPLCAWVRQEMDARLGHNGHGQHHGRHHEHRHDDQHHDPDDDRGRPFAIEPPVAEACRRIVESGFRAEAKRAHPDCGGTDDGMRLVLRGVEALRGWLAGVAA